MCSIFPSRHDWPWKVWRLRCIARPTSNRPEPNLLGCLLGGRHHRAIQRNWWLVANDFAVDQLTVLMRAIFPILLHQDHSPTVLSGRQTWLNLSWSEWVPGAVAHTVCGSAEGIYCISATERGTELLFIGQGKIAQRVAAYKKRPVFCAWAVGAWYPHQRLAIVTDLIASYVLQTGKVPREQFIAAPQQQTGIGVPSGVCLAPGVLGPRASHTPSYASPIRMVVVHARGHSRMRCVHLRNRAVGNL